MFSLLNALSMLARRKLLPNPMLATIVVKLLPNVFRKPSPINIIIDQQLIGISIKKFEVDYLTHQGK